MAARIKGVQASHVIEEWLRSRILHMEPSLPLQNDQHRDNIIRSLVHIYKRMVHGDVIDTGNMSAKEQESLLYAEDLLQQPHFQASIFCSELFVLQDGSTGFSQHSAVDIRRGDLLCIFPALHYPVIVRYVIDDERLHRIRFRNMDNSRQQWTDPQLVFNGEHRIIGTGVLDGHDRYDVHHASISLSRQRRASKYNVTSLHII